MLLTVIAYIFGIGLLGTIWYVLGFIIGHWWSFAIILALIILSCFLIYCNANTISQEDMHSHYQKVGYV